MSSAEPSKTLPPTTQSLSLTHTYIVAHTHTHTSHSLPPCSQLCSPLPTGSAEERRIRDERRGEEGSDVVPGLKTTKAN